MSGFPSRAVQALALTLLLCSQRGSAVEPEIGSAGAPVAEAGVEARIPVQAGEIAPLATPAMELVIPPCPREGDVVTVIAEKRELWLCRQGTSVAKFHVALGRGGLDKRRRGDRRTPLGTYSFGEPRESSRFGVFIPISYPTPDQVAQGFTGSNVGIHGPPRNFVAVTYPVISDDWTEGCIATGLDAEIAYIAEFVREWQPSLVIR